MSFSFRLGRTFVVINGTGKRDRAFAKDIQRSVQTDVFHSISHELGTALNIILNITETAIGDKLVSQYTKENYLQQQLNNIYIMDLVVEDFSVYNKFLMEQHVELRYRLLPLRHVIRTACNLVRSKAMMRSLQLHLDMHDARIPETIFQDERKITQILLNLLQNAIKFTEAGAICVRARYAHSRNAVHVEVEDTGIGMQIEEQRRLRERLDTTFNGAPQRVSHNSSGLGIGLAACDILARVLSNEKRCRLAF